MCIYMDMSVYVDICRYAYVFMYVRTHIRMCLYILYIEREMHVMFTNWPFLVLKRAFPRPKPAAPPAATRPRAGASCPAGIAASVMDMAPG